MENPILTCVRKKLKGNADFKEKTVKIGKVDASLIFLEALIDSGDINDFVVKPLLTMPSFQKASCTQDIAFLLSEGRIYTLDQETVKDEAAALSALIRGCAVLFLDNDTIGYAFEAQTDNIRSVSGLVDESSEQGGKECFVENIKLNTATLRKRLRTPDLRAETLTAGRKSVTGITLFYLADTVDESMLQKAREQIKSIDVDMISSTGLIEETVLGEEYGIFPGILSTERPDRFAAALNEGHIGIMADGFPYGLILPATITDHLNAPEDYAEHPVFATMIRLLRWGMTVITLLAPALYIAVMNFHQEMLPSRLLLSINRAKSEVPFSEFTEIIIMLVAFEVILEAGVRMPQNIGQAVSIVGGLIVGDAAISAKVVSPVVVIVVALTVMASFTLPGRSFARAVKLWRFLLILSANFLGIIGVTVGFILLISSLAGQTVLGVPYLAPLSERKMRTNDTVVRMPFRENRRRPVYLYNRNQIRRR